MVSTESPIRAGLIFQQAERAQQLKQSLRDAGIDLTLELNVQGLREQGLEDEQVEVYIVNLESEIEDMLDEVTELLDATDRPVVYNDADVSSDLSGWDQARWARHLAAKIRKERGTLPPTPAGAEAIPTPRRTLPLAAPTALPDVNLETQPAAAAQPTATAADHSARVADLLAIDTDPVLTKSVPDSPTLELPVDLLQDGMDTAGPEAVSADLSWTLEDVPAEEPAAPLPPAQEAATAAGQSAESFIEDLAVEAEPAVAMASLEFDLPDAFESADVEPDADPLPGMRADAPVQDAGDSEFALPDSAADDTVIIEDSLDFSLEMPVDAEALDLADSTLDSVAGLDDLSMFEPTTDDADLLEALDDSDVADAAVIDELDSLFGTDAEADAGTLDALTGDAMDLPEALLAGELGELDEPTGGATEYASEEIAPDLDALFEGAATDSSLGAEPAADNGASNERSPGLSLPDISQWVLEPLDDLEQAAETVGSGIEPVSEGLDLRNLDAPTPKATNVPAPVASSPPIPASAPDALAELDMDLGLDFTDMELAPEPEAPARFAAAPTPHAVRAGDSVGVTDAGPRRVVILGASIGGPDSIRAYLKAIAPELKAAFLLVQHMGAEFLELMAQQLDRVTPLQVRLASHGAQLKEGEVLVAPVGKRLKFDAKSGVDLSQDAGSTAYSPSIDQVLSDSLARWGASRLLVIIFSGMANDAVAGARQLAEAGVPIWAQDPASCVISSMVDGVVAAKVVSFIGTPEQLAEQTNRLLA